MVSWVARVYDDIITFFPKLWTMTQQEARQWLWPRLVAQGWLQWDSVLSQADPEHRAALLSHFPDPGSIVLDFWRSLKPQLASSRIWDDRPANHLFDAVMALVDALWEVRHVIRSAWVYAPLAFYGSVAVAVGQWMSHFWNLASDASLVGLERWPRSWGIVGSWLLFWGCFGYVLTHSYDDVLATVDQWSHVCVEWWESVVMKVTPTQSPVS